MKIQNKKLAAALIFPILCLILLAVYKGIKVAVGTKIIIPISGYDPRDLLSGHYLTYRLDFKNGNFCSDKIQDNTRIMLCVNQVKGDEASGEIIDEDNYDRRDCDVIIKGKCENGRFSAGIERFYIPEKHCMEIERVIRKGKGKLVVSVDSSGNAVIKDLLINGKSWREFIHEINNKDKR